MKRCRIFEVKLLRIVRAGLKNQYFNITRQCRYVHLPRHQNSTVLLDYVRIKMAYTWLAGRLPRRGYERVQARNTIFTVVKLYILG